MSFPKYPKYKASGVEWLGEVPEHWAIPQIKRTTYLKARVGWKGLTSEEFRDNAFAYLVTGSDFRGKFVEWDKCYQVERDRYEDDPFIQLENGDLLITKDGTIGKLAIVSGLDRPACLNSGIFLARPRNTYSTAFMYWILSSRVFSVFCDLGSFGCTINHLYQNVFERFAFPAPPDSEQTVIVAFLDRETAKIDGLVAEQKRLMELLKEKRQAVISHAVTKGLDPKAPMKPSGVEWLGDVPEHWSVSALKYNVSTINGFGFSSLDFCDQGVPLIRAGNIKNKSLTQPEVFLHKEIVDKYPRVILVSGDIVISMVGSDPKVLDSAVGQVGVVPESLAGAVPNQNVVILREVPNVFVKRYLFFTLCSAAYRNHLDVFSHKLANQSIISSSLLVCAKMTYPKIEEQQSIIDFLDNQLEMLDTLTTEAQRAIDLLQERRTALISAAVTGQIDVRKINNSQGV